VWIFFFVIVLFKSGSGRSVVENNHSKEESTGSMFPVYVRSSEFVNANLHFSTLLCYPSPYTNPPHPRSKHVKFSKLKGYYFHVVRENNVMQKSAGSHLR